MRSHSVQSKSSLYSKQPEQVRQIGRSYSPDQQRFLQKKPSFDYNRDDHPHVEHEYVQGYVIAHNRLGDNRGEAMREVIRDHQHQKSAWSELISGRLNFMPTQAEVRRLQQLPPGSKKAQQMADQIFQRKKLYNKTQSQDQLMNLGHQSENTTKLQPQNRSQIGVKPAHLQTSTFPNERSTFYKNSQINQSAAG